MSLESLSLNKSKEEKLLFLQEKLGLCGLSEKVLADYKDLISKVDFKNIDLSSEAGTIHVDMLSALLTEQKNGEIFFQNILDVINKDLESVDNVMIISAKEIKAESIDLDIGTNRRVDRFNCSFAGGDSYEFTLSADLENYPDDADSNSFIEKEVFADSIGKDNQWLQKYFAYIKKDSRKGQQRFIAKEYLPGKNIAQYFNEMDKKRENISEFINVACETAFAMGGLYKKMNGQLLGDLKLENLIYNYENPDSASPACRICDHSGYHDNEADKRSALQILAHINSFMTIYYSKATKSDSEELRDEAVSIVDAYLDSFIGEIGEDLRDKFLENVSELRKIPIDKRQWELSDDIIDYVLNYDF